MCVCVCVCVRVCVCVCVCSMNIPQSAVLRHSLGEGFVSGSQLDVLQRTAPGVPDAPAPTPQFVAHPLGSSRVQLPKERVVPNNRA